MTEFVHLHVHSDFSLQDAAVSVMSLADRAEELGMKYLALTDHGNMFGAMEFLAACAETINKKGDHEKRKNRVQPIIGCEVYVAPGSRFEKKGAENDNKYFHLVLLAKNQEGYQNLVKLCSFAYTEGFYYRPRVDEDLLSQYHKGLIALSACVSGEIPKLIQEGKRDEAEQKARYYQDLFGKDEEGRENFYLEIQDHGIPAEVLKRGVSQRDINKEIVDISRKTGIPLAATNDVHYLNREDYTAHDILLCIGTGKTRSEERRKKYYGDQFYFKSGDEMAALFPEYPEAIANTVRIAERCTADFLKPNEKTGAMEYQFPRVDIKDLPKFLPDFKYPENFVSADEYLRHLALEGLAKRYAKEMAADGEPWKEIQKRAQYELDLIIEMGFTGYFLIVADFINWAKEHGIPVGPGRGSGAGSIVAYSLGITNIEPLKYKLLFERFLNRERISMPDFDVDFANEGREDVIKYVTEKYGREQVGQIITFGTLGAKAVIKDVARALSISIPESDMITKLIPKDPKITLQKAIDGETKLRDLEQDPRYTELFTLARKLEGLNRHSSLHAAGVVIGKSALHNFVPLYRDSKTEGIATQYSMNFLESCGLVKMDFLGLKTLDVIKHAEELIRHRSGDLAGFSVEAMPEDDEAAFKILGEGKSFEVFQFESEGMQGILRQAKPNSIDELTALNSLYRPGPMQFIPKFIESKWDPAKISYPDPSLEGILKETYGVIVYQEQVMQVAQIIAGFTLGHADELRRAMGKKNMEKMIKEKAKFIAGARERGYTEKKADDIFELLIPFAGYGFNKSHAAAYSVVAYHTAYLKANFPAEFMAANLTNEIHSADKDKLSECISEARKMGLEIDPPDVNRSDKLFTVVDGRIVYGFLGIKGLGDGPAEEIVRCREEGPYTDFIDFLDRVDIKTMGKSVVERLIQTGAFDRMGISRETLLGNMERAVDYAQNKKDDKKFGQSSLFEDSGETEFQDFIFEQFPAMERADKLNKEKELIGFYFSGHPMDEYKEVWQKAVKVDLGHPETLSLGGQILVGLIKNLKTITTGKGDKMAFASLSDYRGEIELAFFSRIWEKYQDHIENDKVVILRGKIDYQKDKDRHSFIVDEWLSPRDIERALKEEDAKERKWGKCRAAWAYMADMTSSQIPAAVKGTYTIIGLLKSLRETQDKKGNSMAFGTLQDYEGDIDLVFFSRIWGECREFLSLDEFVALKGSLDPENDRHRDKPSFKVSSIVDLNALSRSAARKAAEGEAPKNEMSRTPAADNQKDTNQHDNTAKGVVKEAVENMKNQTVSAEPAFRELHIRLQENKEETAAHLAPLRDCLVDKPGSCTVFIHVPAAGGEQVIRTATQLNASAETEQVEALSRCAAVAEVWRQ